MKKISLFFTSLTLAVLSFTAVVNAAEPPTFDKNQQEKMQQQVNINQAQAKDFTQLKGIGEKKAQAIIQYRKLNGAYSSLTDLLKVKGIGQKILMDNKALLTI